jgi:hypothetical protein
MKNPLSNPTYYLITSKLPPCFVTAWLSDLRFGVEITAETLRSWRRASYFGSAAQRGTGRYQLSWPELFMACGLVSPRSNLASLQRQPYTSEFVASRLGIAHRTALEQFRKGKVVGVFKLGAYWYARAADLDAWCATRS